MAIDPKYAQGPGGFYNVIDGSGPYSIASDGTATLIGTGGDGGSSDGLTNAQLRAESVAVRPEFTKSGNLDETTIAGGAAWTKLPAQALSQLTVYNDTGFTLEMRQDGAGGSAILWTEREGVFFGIKNSNQVELRRRDQGAEAVQVQARWES